MKKLIILISVLAMMSVNSVLGAVKAAPIQGTTFDTNNSHETKNANVSLKILDASMSEYNSIRVKAVLEDKSNPAQYKEFQFTASFGGVNLELFQILENNEWKNLDSYPIDRYGAPTGTTALVDMYCEYNSDLIFYLPINLFSLIICFVLSKIFKYLFFTEMDAIKAKKKEGKEKIKKMQKILVKVGIKCILFFAIMLMGLFVFGI